jgi:hypothetical protein
VACASSTTLSSPTTTTAISTDQPLLLLISIHVEGWEDENEYPAKFNHHADLILDTAHHAADQQAIFSFELSSTFALSPGAPPVVSELLSLGHSVEVHADVGGRGTPNLATLTEQLTAKYRQVSSLGSDPVLVSGICSRGPFVEAAIAAGFSLTTGAVEYCLTALDPSLQPPGFDPNACPNPSACHGRPPFDLVTRATPWFTSQTQSWVTPDPAGQLLIVIGESGASLPCLAERELTESGQCQADADDITEFARLAEEYATLESAIGDPCCVFSTSWSIGTAPPEGFTTALVSSVSHLVDNGTARWATPSQVLDAAR